MLAAKHSSSAAKRFPKMVDDHVCIFVVDAKAQQPCGQVSAKYDERQFARVFDGREIVSCSLSMVILVCVVSLRAQPQSLQML